MRSADVLLEMGRILLDAAAHYRNEADDLLVIAAPAIVLGPILVIFASSGLGGALGTIPAFVLLFLLAHAACVRAAGLLKSGLRPDPAVAYLDVARRLALVLRAAAPGALLVAGISAAALVVGDLDYSAPALGLGVLGALAAFFWGSRHTYDLPLILIHGLVAEEAARLSEKVTGGNQLWTTFLLALVGAPLLVALLVSWGLAAVLSPPVGAIVFAAALALWLPFQALTFAAASDGLFGGATR